MKRIISLVIVLLVGESAFATTFPKRVFKVDESVNPCVNFYEYACNATIREFELPKTRSLHIFSFNDTSENLLTHKKNYFKQLENSKPSSSREEQIQAFYKSCMNEKSSKKAEQQFVKETLKKVESLQTREQFADFIFQKMKSGEFSFFEFSGGIPNFKNSQKMDGYFLVTVLSLPEKSYYSKEGADGDIQSLAKSFFETLNIDRAEERAKWILSYEKELSQVVPTAVELNAKVFSFTEMPKELMKKLPNLRLAEFVGQLPGTPHIRHLTGDAPLRYVEESLTQAPLDQLKSVYLYHALKNVLDDAYPDFKKKVVAFNSKYRGGPVERPDRQERCTQEIETAFAMELDSILMPKLFPNFPKDKISSMVEKIREGLIKDIDKNTWLSAKAKKEAALKLKTLNIRLISPENDQEWNFQKEGPYSATNIVENRLLYSRLRIQKQIEDFEKNFNSVVWGFGPLAMNAALLPPYNAIIFPIAMFQPPFYDPEAPEEVNMAAIGTVIGHELGHAIDDKGYTFDYKGRINPWIAKADEKKFSTKAKPLIDQFDKAGENGKFTLGENIGDLVGLTNAYKQAFPKSSNKPLALKKEFFTQYARLWCEVQKPEVIEIRKKTDPHALGVSRTNEQVKQQPGFADAFSCKQGDPMVLPKEKLVRIW